MEICNEHSKPIAYPSDSGINRGRPTGCPACAIQEDLDEANSTIEDLKDQLAEAGE